VGGADAEESLSQFSLTSLERFSELSDGGVCQLSDLQVVGVPRAACRPCAVSLVDTAASDTLTAQGAR